MRRILLGAILASVSLLTPFPDPSGAVAQTSDQVIFSGHIYHAETGEPIRAAQVSVVSTRGGALSDGDGVYRVTVRRSELPGGDVRLLVQRLGFEAQEVVVGASRSGLGSVVTTDIRLRPMVLALQGIVAGSPSIVATGRVEAGAVSADRIARASLDAASGPAPSIRVAGEPPNREQYDFFQDHAFLSVAGNPLSTFSIDVDRASYSNVRRFLHEGRLPPVDAVRVEEMLNYFTYDYPTPDGEHPVAVATELGAAPWNEEHLLLRIGLASAPIETEALPPNNLVFLLDVSGSMNQWNKLPLVKRSLRLLVNELREEDRVAIVVYAGSAGLVLDSTPGTEKGLILEAIENLEAGGSTAGGAGLRLAYRVARENFLERGNNRVILATDGDFNVGESSDAAMVRLIEEMRGEGTFLTVLGFGTGNLQSEKMQSLAQHGNGNYGYVDSLQEASKLLVSEMGGTLVTVAQDVKLQVEFNPNLVRAYRLIGYENRLLAAEDFNDDAKDAGDLGAGHRVTALYEVVPVGAETDVDVRGTDPLRYQTTGEPSGRATEGEVAFVRLRYKEPRGETSRLLEHPVGSPVNGPSDDFNFAAAVAGFGMILRESQHRGSITTEEILALARTGLGEDREGYRRDFVEMVQAYERIAFETDGWRER